MNGDSCLPDHMCFLRVINWSPIFALNGQMDRIRERLELSAINLIMLKISETKQVSARFYFVKHEIHEVSSRAHDESYWDKNPYRLRFSRTALTCGTATLVITRLRVKCVLRAIECCPLFCFLFASRCVLYLQTISCCTHQ